MNYDLRILNTGEQGVQIQVVEKGDSERVLGAGVFKLESLLPIQAALFNGAPITITLEGIEDAVAH